ncbi:MAG: MCE family protein [Deltaproteobacteria bacterium]|nr:MCE family protein [Deltaproteobacteria bacterium]
MLLAQDQRLARRVGTIGLVVIALAIAFFVFVYDRIEWGRHVRVRVYFHSTGGLVEGAPFVVAGREVGKVEAIVLSPQGAPTPLQGDEGVEVRVAIDADDAAGLVHGDVFVASKGPLSARYLELGPPAPDAPRVAIHEKDQLLGSDPPTLDRVFQRTWDNLTTLGGFLDEMHPEMAELRTQLTALQQTLHEVAPDVALRADIDALIAEAGRTRDALGGRPGLDRNSALIDHTRVTVTQARAMVAALRTKADARGASLAAVKARLGTRGSEAIDKVELAIDRVKAVLDKVDPLLAQVDAIQQRIARGEGSLLKLMHDPEFPEEAKELGKIMKRQPWKLIDRPQ